MKRPNMIRRTGVSHGISRPLVTPLQPSVVYAADNPDALDSMYEGREEGFTYSREGHPNASVLAAKLDQLEGGQGGIITSSGMSAITALFFGVLKAGDHIIGGNQLYGRSMRMMNEELPRLGIATSLADPTDVNAIRAAIRPETKMILVEVVSNPTLRLADMEGILALAAEMGILVAVDNTFTTPFGYQPFAQGADFVVHSVTKLLAGHSDVMAGYVVARDPEHQKRIEIVAVTMGLTASPFDSWLGERGLFTFELRYEKAQQNAAELAEFIASQPGVKRVLYPGRADHPDHNRAAALLNGQFGNMVSFEVTPTRNAANALANAVPQLAFAPTLGDVGTTLSHPASSSHRALTEQDRAELGMSEGFFRVSVGIENIDLLKEDFKTAIQATVAKG
ncbi:MAG: aminotransferase class I/II-fold pyridoxal phosphate-dependent enzyme [Paracoccaceae bacterium]|nr:aminotransferase class I/II-fold pyridoxal phosphate-dependent enzyme [Paracoccaceae bacterium]